VPSHTNGTRTDTSPVVDLASGITSGTAVITMTAFPNETTYEQGDVFTIDGVYDVNQETKEPYSHLKQWVVTADETETGSGDMSPAVSPTPITSGAKQNCYAAAWSGSAAVNNLDTGGSGAASLRHTQNLAYHRSAISVAFASLPMPHGDVGKQVVMDNVSMRMWQFSDGINDTHTTRFDVLFGWLVQRPEYACRVRG
jgi:hypothetical protein